MIKYEKELVGRFTRYALNGWMFYVLSDFEERLDKELEQCSGVTAKLMRLIQFSDYAIDDQRNIMKCRTNVVTLIETYLRTL